MVHDCNEVIVALLEIRLICLFINYVMTCLKSCKLLLYNNKTFIMSVSSRTLKFYVHNAVVMQVMILTYNF